MSWVWPRLPAGVARTLYEEQVLQDPAELREAASTEHPLAAPIAVGGAPVPVEGISELQSGIRAIADGLGFPEPLGEITSFDQPAGRLLHERMGIIPADSGSDEVWSFLTLVVLPDVAAWRFPGRTAERILGRPRNTFRRLWWRVETVGVDLIDVPGGLGEDELVAIMERTTVAADPRSARLLGKAIFESEKVEGVSRTELMRDVAKRYLRTQAVLALEILDDSEIGAILNRHLEDATNALSRPQHDRIHQVAASRP